MTQAIDLKVWDAMRYTEIFDEVVSIMKNDSSTCNDLGAGNFQHYKDQIKDDMPVADFSKVVKKYMPHLDRKGIFLLVIRRWAALILGLCVLRMHCM